MSARGIKRSAKPMRAGAACSLEEACEMIAELRDFKVSAVVRLVSRGPLLFFPNATRNGDLSWRIPARDVRALLGGGSGASMLVSPWDRLVSARTFASWCELKAPSTVIKAMKRGEIAKVVVLGEWRIPVSEFLRITGNTEAQRHRGGSPTSTGRQGPGRPSFFTRMGDSERLEASSLDGGASS